MEDYGVGGQPAKKQVSGMRRTAGIRLSEELINKYLDKLEASGCARSTLQSYRRSLEQLFQFLPEQKYIQADTLAAWRDSLLDAGYSAKTVNVRIAAANGLMLYLNCWEFQAERLPDENHIQPELTRTEYLRLLSTARTLGKERVYLLIKVFATTGLSVGDVEKLTAEAVRAGKIILESGCLRISDGLREELLHFIREECITSGPVFLTKGGKPQGRTVVTKMIKTLCRDAQVSEEKATPRCLHKLYLSTQNGILENLFLLAEQAYERMLEKEQNAIGWDWEK